ncbi:MAG: hypothetical protein E6Q77_10560, partial [Rhizobium sp.]
MERNRTPAYYAVLSVAWTAWLYLRTMLVFALVWYAASRWIHNPILLPSPIDTFKALGALIGNGELLSNALSSFRRLATSFALACVIGIPLGFVMAMNQVIYALVDPLIEILRPISGIAWIPLGMFILG